MKIGAHHVRGLNCALVAQQMYRRRYLRALLALAR
jgi:hypothetical protein